LGVVVAESVEVATILLTDLVGSTRLANSVGPVRADELREEHFELLRDAIASGGGREVKNTGDGLMVAFASPSGAVRCAVALQQGFERRYRQAEQALHVRVGLGAGESTVKDGDYFGMPTVEAARLCAQAPSNGILISGLVKTLAGRCDGVEFTSAGRFELKGFDEPVEAFSVSWAPLVEEAGGPSRVASIDTGDPRRDARLCAQDFFDVEHHPTASFRGDAPPMGAGNVLAVRGMMTLRGASRPVELIAEPSRAADGKGNGDRWVRARGVISRREFGLDWDSAFAAGGLVIDDRVALRLDVALRRACSA
jgi:class 3 adenylate cyclase